MKVILPDFLEKNYTVNKTENLSICQYIQYEEQHKNEVFIATNILIFVIKGSKTLHFKDEKIVVNSEEILFLKSGNYVMSEMLDDYYEAILFMYDDALLLDFIKKYTLSFDGNNIFENNVFKIKKTLPFEILQSSILSYLKETASNQASIIKLKLEEAFLNILQSDSKEDFNAFLSSIYTHNFFKTKIEKEFEVDKNILLFAKEFHLGSFAFRNKFKETFGTTPKKWQTTKRLEKAKLLLESSDDNVTQVCQKCGYDNISWFIQSFKKKYHITPKQIKNNKK